ncbi:MAG: hypothetical protein ABIS30_00705 [Gallionella sp.]
MNDDDLECRRFQHRVIDHLLEYWPLVVGGRCTRLDVLLHHQMAVGLRPFVQLAQLIGNRQIIVGLP